MSGIEVEVSGQVPSVESHELWLVYDEVFHDKDTEWEWLESWDRHSNRAGFRLARARADGDLVGFAYGYTGEAGQWWTDRALSVLAPVVAEDWLGGHFELVSIGVVSSARGRGAGRILLEEITSGLTQDRWMLMTTADEDDPARHLYASNGWAVVGPGLTEDGVIMGKRRAPNTF